MDNAVLEAHVRDKSVKAKALRRDHDLVTAEFYGHGVANIALTIDHQSFRKLYRKAGENTIIDLKIDGANDQKALVQRVEYHPVTGDVSHVDFINVRMNEEVTTHVAIKLEGLAPAVKELAGTLIQSLNEIEVRCLPADLIHEVVLNVDSLVDFHTVLHVSDIKVSDKITVLTDPGTAVALVSAPRAEETEEVEEVDVANVELAGEKKEEAAE